MKRWISQVARSQALNWLQGRKSHEPLEPEMAASTPSPSPSREQERFEKLVEVLHQLPPTEREVLSLHYIGEQSYQAIAEQLDIPYTTVKFRLAEGRKHLKEKLVVA